MPWHCPNCWFPIAHLPAETAPKTGKTYQCPICKLDWTFDDDKGELVLAPVEPIEPETPHHKKSA